MEFKIDNLNYRHHLKNDKSIVIDTEFIKDNSIEPNALIKIEGIVNKEVMLYIYGVTLNELNIDVEDCSLYGIFLENASIKELKLLSLDISEFKEAKFKTFKTYFDKSNLKSIWIHGSKFFNGLLVRNESNIENIRIDDSFIDYSFTHFNSNSLNIEIESSTLDDLNIEKSDIHKIGIKSAIETINIFRTEIRAGFRISEIEFTELNLHKLNVLKSTELSDFNENIYISLPKEHKEVDKIEITECNIDRGLIITLSDLKEFYSRDCSFILYRINFYKITSFKFLNITVLERIFWGFQNHLKSIEKFVFNNCQIKGGFYLSDTHFKEELSIQGTSFYTYPSFFEDNAIYDTCKVDFQFTNLTNFVFQDIDFRNVSFKNIDIDNAEFKNCEWESDSKLFLSRFKVQDENQNSSAIENLIINKKIYSKLKSSFQKSNNYLYSGKFYISEQESKKVISLKNKDYFEYLLLLLHKKISSYGESVAKPLLLLLILTLCSAFIYFFTGFNSGERFIKYEFILNQSNTYQTFKDFLESIIFSIKNTVPFSISNQFFLNSIGIKVTQVIELIQKILSLILIASFTESFVRYLKK